MASSSSTLHCQWECRIQMEKAKQRRAAGLTKDAATYHTLKRCASNGWKWRCSPHLKYCSEFLCRWLTALQFFVVFVLFIWIYPIFSEEEFLLSILIHALLPLLIVTVSVCAYVCVYGAPLHVGLLSPSHTSGAGNGTELPEGPNFTQLPNPSLFSHFFRLLAFQEYASQVLGNLHAALLPSSIHSTYTHSFSLLLLFHIPIPTLALHFCLSLTFI